MDVPSPSSTIFPAVISNENNVSRNCNGHSYTARVLAEDEVEVMVINEKKREKRQGHGSSMQGQKQTAETRVQITGYSLSLSLSFCARGLTSKAVRRVHTNGERLNKCVGELERAVISLSWTSYKTPAALLYLYLAD